MKVKVTRNFRDKYTHARYVAGAVLDITEKRYQEIMGVGKFVEMIPQDAQNDAETSAGNDAINVSNDEPAPQDELQDAPTDELDAMNVRELKEYAEKTHNLTIKAGTKKAEIIETLRRMKDGK